MLSEAIPAAADESSQNAETSNMSSLSRSDLSALHMCILGPCPVTTKKVIRATLSSLQTDVYGWQESGIVCPDPGWVRVGGGVVLYVTQRLAPAQERLSSLFLIDAIRYRVVVIEKSKRATNPTSLACNLFRSSYQSY